MVQVHFVENLSGVINAIPSGFGASLFTFLSGVSYRLWLNGQEARGRKDVEISKVTIRRGLFLIGTGFAFNILVWLPEDTFNWDVLTFIGAAMMFLNVARKLPTSALVAICLLVYAVSPPLRVLSDYSEYWTNSYFECDMTLTDITLGFFVNGFFPIFPWIIYPITGFALATQLFPETKRAPGTLARMQLVGLGLIAFSLALLFAKSYTSTAVQSVWLTGWTMFPASATYVPGTLGFAITAFTFLHRWIDSSPVWSKGVIAKVASTFSTHSFTVYILHHVVHLWPLWVYAVYTGKDATEYWQKAMTAGQAWPLAFGFLLACYFVLVWMERTKKPGMETVMRWVCD